MHLGFPKGQTSTRSSKYIKLSGLGSNDLKTPTPRSKFNTFQITSRPSPLLGQMAPTTLSLAGKTAIVTGSGRENGIGAAIAVTLAQNGARVVVNYVSDASAVRAAKVVANIKALGAEAIAIQANVSTPEGASKLVNDTLSGFATDKVDILSMPAPCPNPQEQPPRYEY